jgi:hypothetical protein
MNQNFGGWEAVGRLLKASADKEERNDARLNLGQRKSLGAIAERISKNGIILADEVGMGKTRIAVEVARSVVESGGRVAIIVPPGLGYQWQEELRDGALEAPAILRSLWAYLNAPWSDQGAWFKKQVVVLSHLFTNWRLSDKSAAWRWALLPELYAHWRSNKGSYPRGYHQSEELLSARQICPNICIAANSIINAVAASTQKTVRDQMEQLRDETPWPGALDAEEYGRDESLRVWLERAVGLGLGLFDLVIIDEAHKSRGTESGLSRLLDNVILKSEATRHLAMTATPVELDVTHQWQGTLSRIGLANWILINGTIENYVLSVKELRDRWHNEKIRTTYEDAARNFHGALSPYVLRRDKREDASVQKFKAYSNLSIHDYRKTEDIVVHVEKLASRWRQAICAAESLSIAACNAEDPVTKRLRLTLGSGHGIANWLNDKNTMAYDSTDAPKEDCCEEIEPIAEIKRRERVAWWTELIEKAFRQGKDPMFDHPAIMAAVAAIEKETARGEKVLVFGRFTRPMRRLVDLLNAREMLRCLLNQKPWPQAKVHGERTGDADSSQWPAARAALKQMSEEIGPIQIKEDDLDRLLGAQYNQIETQRKRLRANLLWKIEEGFRELDAESVEEKRSFEKALSVFKGFQRCCQYSDRSEDNLVLLVRALFEIREYTDDVKPIQFAKDFCDLVGATSDKDDPDADANKDGIVDEDESEDLWAIMSERLTEEFKTNQSSYARMMYGNTSLASRRIIQLAFNRASSFTKVLVAQSMVGREGLNLHKCCRIVVMLHPEWNPGVVEQQIGRVDRVGSHWCKQLEQAIAAGCPANQLPRIEIRPVIFRGTYDEHNWKVLQERWDDLRAQLHGIIIPPGCVPDDRESREILERISKAAPNFSSGANNL